MKKTVRSFIGIILAGSFLISGCSINRMAVKQGAGVIAQGLPAFYREGDLHLAETALAANIKLMEALLESAPKDPQLLNLTAQAMTAYSFGFVETGFERFEYTDPDRAEAEKNRAKVLYRRAIDYSRRALKGRKGKLVRALDGSLNDVQAQLEKLSGRYVPYAFWLAFAWGSYINLSKDDITVVADAAKVEAIMLWVIEHDERYFNGGAHLFLGGFYGSRSRMFGGDPLKAKIHFDKVDDINDQKLLMNKVLEARFLAVQLQDRQRFQQLVNDILQAGDDLYPEQNLMNAMAKARAEILQANEKEYF